MKNKHNIVFDSASKRSIDRNGFMHVEKSNLTKESVDPYFGYEIPNSQALGLDPDKIYFGYRKGEEIAKGAKTFNGLPLMREHHLDNAENPQREHRVGAVGTNCEFNSPYLQASLTITDAEAIRKIETGERMELSASYYFVPVLEKGEFNGQPYDFVMTEIQGNHVALVEEGRAGADVCVADSKEPVKAVLDNNITTKKDNHMEEIKEEEKAVVDNEVKTACDNEGIVDAEKQAEDDELDIEEVLQSAGLAVSEDLKKAFMAGMHYASKAEQAVEPVTVDNEVTADNEVASDSEVTAEDDEPEKKESPAMDANSIKKALRAEMREIQTAVRDVRALVGELDAVAFDSAEDVYLKACSLMGVQATKKSARDVCRALAQIGKTAVTGVAMDSAINYGFKSRFDA